MFAKDTAILLECLIKVPTQEHAAFIRSIQEAGADEAPRKVYADWLDENGLPDEAEYQRNWNAKFEESKAWLEEFCVRYRADYDDLVKGAVNGDGYCFGETDGPYAVDDEFWKHVQVVTQKELDSSHRENTYFHCAC